MPVVVIINFFLMFLAFIHEIFYYFRHFIHFQTELLGIC